MKIALLSCFYPYRGGISEFNSFLVKELSKSHTVKAFNFTRQYPNILFPGKTQYVEDENLAASIDCESILDTANPFSYLTSAKKISEWGPDLLITRYWMSYFAPSLGTVISRVKTLENKKGNNLFRTLSITDNAIPHEKHFFDTPLTKFYIRRNDGFITMSSTVAKDIKELNPNKKVITLQHPLYTNYGEIIAKKQALKNLGLESKLDKKIILFFGLIRDYKGLDLLLKAFALLGEDYHLIVAGEPYGGFDKYNQIIQSNEFLRVKDNLTLKLEFVKDSEVKNYFCAADVCVLPYKSATQSGISSIAWNFELPQIATPVGGLPENLKGSKTGIITTNVSAESIAERIKFFFDNNICEDIRHNIRLLKKELTWENFCSKLIEFSKTL